jgi:hypothetical protein
MSKTFLLFFKIVLLNIYAFQFEIVISFSNSAKKKNNED